MRPYVPNNTVSVEALDGVAVIIPARMAASRLPGKPLEMIGDAPMIVQVMRRAWEAGFGQNGQTSRVVVACDDQRIADAVIAHGGEAVLTDPDHPSGSDRVYEALTAIDPEGKIDTVINLQGDLPDIDASILPPLVAALRDQNADIATPVAPAHDHEIPLPQVVKAVVVLPDGQDKASLTGAVGPVLYFSRQPIPHGAGGGAGDVDMPIWHHVGIYAWSRQALAKFVSLPPSPLEKTEKLEQLRALENGMSIMALVVDSAPGGVDTHEDLEAARRRIEKS